jgi:uncharacterized protein YcnI
MSLPGLKLLAAAVTVTAIGALTVSAASAHVTVQPSTATQGASDVTFSFRVPNEEDSADTTQLEVQFPTDHPIPSVAVQPTPGWTSKVSTTKLAQPIQTDDGQVTEVVSDIAWSGATIKPGEFDQFTVLAGSLPDNVDSLTFKAVQTYSNGDVVRWIDTAAPGAAEPQHPAPTLTLTKATSTSSDNSDSTARLLGIIGIAVGVIGVAVAVVAVLMSRRKPSPPTTGPPHDALAAP